MRKLPTSRRVLKPWTPPPVGWLKANLDGAFQVSSHQGGVGVVFRDSSAVVVGGICMKLADVSSPDMVEAFAGRAACEFAAEFHLSPVVFESDCIKVVKSCSGSVEDDSAFGQWRLEKERTHIEIASKREKQLTKSVKKKMKLIIATSTGGPDVLKEMEVPEQELKDDGVLIQVAATALNEPDITSRKRSLPPQQREYLGLECAGTILKVGRNVQRWQVGQEVCAVLTGGGYAEKVAVQEGLVFPIPKGISVEEAASFPQVACSVWAAVFMEEELDAEYWLPDDGRKSRLNAGETILVHGGSGGIGSFAIQLAKARGVKVIAAAGSDKVEFCKKLGADACISFNYKDKDKEDDFIERVTKETDANKGVDVVLSNLPIEFLPWSNACVKQGGTVIKINGCWMLPKDTRAKTPQPKKVNSELVANVHIGVAGFRFRKLQKRAKVVEEVHKHVWPLIEAGKIKPVVYHRFPFSKAAEAHRLMESGKHFGKILLIPNDKFENSGIGEKS